MIIAIIIAIIVWIAYNKIFVAKFNPAKLPTGGKELPNSWIASKKYVGYAERLWRQIGGLSLGVFTTDALCQEINALTDDQLGTIYNYYNDVFGKSDGSTLTEKLSNEWFTGSNTSDLIARLKKLKYR